MISAEDGPPIDRPNLSKDYLAGEAQDEWMPLRPPEYYTEQRIDLLLGARVSSIDVNAREVRLENGQRHKFGALLIATGADPVRLPIPGADSPHVHYLRSFADCRAIIEKTQSAKHVVVVGASFIGLEVSASLRARGIAVDVVAPDRVPLERVMGPEVGRFVQDLHEAQGVVFHLGQTVTGVDGRTVTLSGGTTLDADFVVMGVGVRPATALAETAGLELDRGIVVNEYLETSVPGIFAAGDVARWPGGPSGERIRVEHWVVAERQGQVAARNMLGYRERFAAVPFFWSQHYDVTIRYVGHAEQWETVAIDGSLDARDARVRFLHGGKTLAVATVSRDRENLQAELELRARLNEAVERSGATMMPETTSHEAAQHAFVKGVHGVRYQVKDVARSVTFYTQHLGFTLKHQQLPAFANVSLGDAQILLSGPGASGSRPMPNGEQQEPGGWNGWC